MRNVTGGNEEACGRTVKYSWINIFTKIKFVNSSFVDPSRYLICPTTNKDRWGKNRNPSLERGNLIRLHPCFVPPWWLSILMDCSDPCATIWHNKPVSEAFNQSINQEAACWLIPAVQGSPYKVRVGLPSMYYLYWLLDSLA